MNLKSDLLRVLSERGFIKQATDLEGLDALLESEAMRAYIGFDLTAPSLHVGSLVQLMVLRWMHRLGHKPVALLGTATTRIGDPTGKTESRRVMTDGEIDTNRDAIQNLISHIVQNDKCETIDFRDNRSWFDHMTFTDMMRDVFSEVSVPRLLSLDAVNSRLDNNGTMTLMELCYPSMQAYDFLQLHDRLLADVQIGGSDQWGNIVAGVDLVRRKTGKTVFGITTPLFVNSAGQKMGKTAEGAIWLSPDMFSPYDFYQFWRNVEDRMVETYLKLFTEIPLLKISEMMARNVNEAKEALAFHATAIVHTFNDAVIAQDKARAIFLKKASDAARVEVNIPRSDVIGWSIIELLAKHNMAASKSAARRLCDQGGVKLNHVCPVPGNYVIDRHDIRDGVVHLSVGKKNSIALRIY